MSRVALSDSRQTKKAYASIPTPLVVLAAHVDGRPVGMVVGSFVAQSFDPPLVSVSIQHTSTTWPSLRAATHLGISLLSEAHHPLISQFAGPAEQRFQGVDLRQEGSALLLAEASLQLTCRLIDEWLIGDHTQAILEIVESSQGVFSPVVYRNRQVSAISSMS